MASPDPSGNNFEQNNFGAQSVTGSGDIHHHGAAPKILPGELRWEKKYYPFGRQIRSGVLGVVFIVLFPAFFFSSIAVLSQITEAFSLSASVSMALNAGLFLSFAVIAFCVLPPVFCILSRSLCPVPIKGAERYCRF